MHLPYLSSSVGVSDQTAMDALTAAGFTVDLIDDTTVTNAMIDGWDRFLIGRGASSTAIRGISRITQAGGSGKPVLSLLRPVAINMRLTDDEFGSGTSISEMYVRSEGVPLLEASTGHYAIMSPSGSMHYVQGSIAPGAVKMTNQSSSLGTKFGHLIVPAGGTLQTGEAATAPVAYVSWPTSTDTPSLTQTYIDWLVAVAIETFGDPADVTPPADTTAPSVPVLDPVTAVGADGASLAWSASTDAVGVASYRVIRNGSIVVGQTTALTRTESGLAPGTYTWTVSAVDAAGNRSAESDPQSLTVESAPTVVGDVLATETFTTDGTWPSGWSTYLRPGAVASVIDGQGDLALPSGTYQQGATAFWTAMPSVADQELLGTFGVPADQALAAVAIRSTGVRATDVKAAYGYQLVFDARDNDLHVRRRAGSTDTDVLLGTATFAYPAASGTFRVRVQAQGGTIRVRAWTGATEPTTWLLELSDPAPYLEAGRVHLFAGSNGPSSGPLSLRVDDLTVSSLGAETTDPDLPTLTATGPSGGVEPFTAVTLSATSTDPIVWTEGGVEVGTGSSVTLTPPASFAGGTVTYLATATNAAGSTAREVKVQVLPATDGVKVAGAIVPTSVGVK